MTEQVCGYRWYGPRPEVADAFANHVCQKEPRHDENVMSLHQCVCGAEDLDD